MSPSFFLGSSACAGVLVVLAAVAGAVLFLPAALARWGHRVERAATSASGSGTAPRSLPCGTPPARWCFSRRGVGTVTVLVDATLVRAVLLPVTMRPGGRADWWVPRPLRRTRLRGAAGRGRRTP
ncbi:hypothetical protein ACFWHW_25780 [Streptomyces pharetrae]|uniref:hypothetical protein n=1 Tax=Streptomyces pharetrae TaxID=291370 RepID=UPI0036663EC5